MKITCPHCGATGNISDNLVPDSGRGVSCPKCRSRFTVSKAPSATGPSPSSGEKKIPVRCPACGATGSLSSSRVGPGGISITCPKCKTPFSVKAAGPAPSAAPGEGVPYRCPRCGREGNLPSVAVPQGGKGMNCPECNTRFFVRRPDEAGVAPPSPAATSSPDRGPISPGPIRPGVVDRPPVGPGGPSTFGSPAMGGGAVSSPVSRSAAPGGPTGLDDIWSTPSIGRAVAGGAGAALVGAMIWAFITVMTGFQIGWMAIGVGALVGFAVKFMGRGTEQTYGFIGAGLAVFGCVIGNLMAACAFISSDPRNAGFVSVLFDALLSPSTAARIMGAHFHPLDVLFYVLAITTGYKVALSTEKA
jgi:predicted Zn finger-like uncharacterized protein